MFIIENLLKRRKSAMDEWTEEAQKWVNQKNESASYTTYDLDDYHRVVRNRPGKKIKWSEIVMYTFVTFAGLGLVFVIIGAIVSGVKEHNVTMNATKEGVNCRMFNKNDHIRITSGHYKNNNGTIIGGCEKGTDYQIKLDKGSKADVPSDGQNEVDVSGKTVGVGSYKDLTIIEVKDGTDTSK